MAASQLESVAAPQRTETATAVQAQAQADGPAQRPPALVTEGTGLVEAPATLLQRVLLTTDGNVGRILENYAGEAIEAVKLEQVLMPGGEPNHALELTEDDERLLRRVILRGSTSGRNLLYAETIVVVGRLHPLVHAGLLSTSEPIGRLMTVARIETFRDILSTGRTRAGAVGAHFGVTEDEHLFVRTYRIMAGGHPMMLITEKFPTTWFC